MENKDEALVQLHRTFFWQSEKIIKSNNWDDLDKLYESLPADHMHINDPVTMAMIYADPNMRKLSNIVSPEDLAARGLEESAKRVNPDNFQRNVQLTMEFLQRANPHEVGILFQQMNTNEDPDAEMEWYVTFMKVSEKARGIFCLDFKVSFLDRYQNKFMKLIELDEFVHSNMDKFQSLTAREIEVMTKLAKGMSNQEIGDELHLSKLTVDTHRKNIMAKLEIKRFVDLIRFAEAFDLV